MTQRIWFALEDDWELRGNGLGEVAHLQHTPALFLMDVARSLGIRVSFMAEVLQQLAFERAANASRRLRLSGALWRETVAQMIEEGHDVQLHLHPQWHEAAFEDGFFRHRGSWNIAEHPDERIAEMVSGAAGYLRELILPLRPSWRLCGFKAGAWAMQPAPKVLDALAREGIHLIMGPGLSIGYRLPGFVADYRGIEEPVLPYCPDPERVECIAAAPNPYIVLPMPYYRRDMVGHLHALAKRAFGAARGSRLPDALAPVPRWVGEAAPSFTAGNRTARARIGNLAALRTFDIGGVGFVELRRGIDQIVARALATDAPIVPIVLQSHTKGYEGAWQDIRRFLTYVVERFGTMAEFVTVTDVWNRRAELAVRGANVAAP